MRIYTLRLCKALMLLQIFIITWGCSGTSPEFLMTMLPIPVAVFALLSFAGETKKASAYERLLVFAALGVCLVGFVQWFNPYGVMVVDERFTYLKSVESVGWLPSSIMNSFEGGNALSAMAPLFAALLTAINAMLLFRDARFAKLSAACFAGNITLMALFAVCQKMSNTPILYNTYFSTGQFFGSFFYSNAACTFINMGLAANLAIFLHFWTSERGNPRMASFLFLLFGILCTGACAYSGSNGGLLLSFVCWALFVAYCVFVFAFSGEMRRGLALLMVFAAAALSALFYFSFGKDIAKSEKLMEKSSISRLVLYKIGAELVRERPVYGYGGDSAGYFLSQKMMSQRQAEQMFNSTRRAHSDYLDYVLEYGALGAAGMLVLFFAWLGGFFARLKGLTPSNGFFMLGALLCMAHGVFDFPLHIPSVIFAFAFVSSLALSSTRERREGAQ